MADKKGSGKGGGKDGKDGEDGNGDDFDDKPFEGLTPLEKLTKDLKAGGALLTPHEARFLVDTYYIMQESRKRSRNQLLALKAEPHETLEFFATQFEGLERQVGRTLDVYSNASTLGQWARSIVGIGPIISAGLLAHIDLNKAPTVGHIWRYAGLDPTSKWPSKEKAKDWVTALDCTREEAVVKAAGFWGRNVDMLRRMATTNKKGETVNLTNDTLTKAICRRPWNASLRTLCWKIGESFVKVQNNENDYYGKLYIQRKDYEQRMNEAGDLADRAKSALIEKNYSKNTDAYLWYSGCLTPEDAKAIFGAPSEQREGMARKLSKAPGSGVQMLPPGHIHARAKRWAVKLFLSHYHERGYELVLGKQAPAPYSMVMLQHVHKINPPE